MPKGIAFFVNIKSIIQFAKMSVLNCTVPKQNHPEKHNPTLLSLWVESRAKYLLDVNPAMNLRIIFLSVISPLAAIGSGLVGGFHVSLC